MCYLAAFIFGIAATVMAFVFKYLKGHVMQVVTKLTISFSNYFKE